MIGEAIAAAEIGAKIDEIGAIGLIIGEAIAGAIEAMFGIIGEAIAGAAIEAYGEIPYPKAILILLLLFEIYFILMKVFDKALFLLAYLYIFRSFVKLMK